MNLFSFRLWIDLPLVALLLLIFLRHLRYWAFEATGRSEVNLAVRLPQARRRLIALSLALLAMGWLTGIAVWAALSVLTVVGLLAIPAQLFVSGSFDVTGALLGGYGAVAVGIREWCFGFPNLILQEQPDLANSPSLPDRLADQLGKSGVVITPLCPTGRIDLQGEIFEAISEEGTLLDPGTPIRVTRAAGGLLTVRALQ